MRTKALKTVTSHKDKKRKHISNHVESATVCIDNILNLSEREVFLLFRILYNSDGNNIIRNIYGDIVTRIDDVGEIIGLCPQNEALRNLKQKNVLKKIKYNKIYVYAINPYVAHRGRSVDPEVYMGFSNTSYRYVYGEDYFEEVLV